VFCKEKKYHNNFQSSSIDDKKTLGEMIEIIFFGEIQHIVRK